MELRRDLREVRDAIDRYKDLADQGKIRVEAGTEGYPPDLETLAKGVNVGVGNDTKIRFLRRIPIDPMTGRPDWNLNAIQARLDELGRQERLRRTHQVPSHGLDGTKYSEW
jgi:general secretion pathway protein G